MGIKLFFLICMSVELPNKDWLNSWSIQNTLNDPNVIFAVTQGYNLSLPSSQLPRNRREKQKHKQQKTMAPTKKDKIHTLYKWMYFYFQDQIAKPDVLIAMNWKESFLHVSTLPTYTGGKWTKAASSLRMAKL